MTRLRARSSTASLLCFSAISKQKPNDQISVWQCNQAHAELTIKELDDVSKVHVVLDDYVPVGLYKRQRHEQVEVLWAHVLGRPDSLPHAEHVVVDKLSLEVQQEPAVRAANREKRLT